MSPWCAATARPSSAAAAALRSKRRKIGNGMRATSGEQPPVTLETGNRNAETKGSLLRILGVGFGLAVIVGNTIGAGILRTPGEIAKYLPSPWVFLTVWVIGGLYALLGSFSMAELGAMMPPRSGGYYVFARRAFGEFIPAFVIGWDGFSRQARQYRCRLFGRGSEYTFNT